MKDYFELGQVANTFGIKGIIKIKPFTDDIEQFEEFKYIYMKSRNNISQYTIEEVKYHKNMILLKLKGIDTLEQAQLLKNSLVIMERNSLKPLSEGQYYIVDLIGLDVYTDENVFIGKLEDIYNTVRYANERAIEKVCNNVLHSDIDNEARTIIKDAGYEQYFTHRLGHGIGTNVHEPFDVSGSSDILIKSNMCFSIEPGIYIKDNYGVRIEDLVIATDNGYEVLNKFDKKLIIKKVEER